MSARFSSLKLRSISAVVAVLALVAIYWAFDLLGLIGIVIVAHLILSIEGYSLLFAKINSKLVKTIFFIGCFWSFALSGFFPDQMMIAFIAITSIYWATTVLLHSEFANLDAMVEFQSKSIFGFVYFGVLPGLVVQILLSNSGFSWFCMLLSIVFAGDIGAYISGLTLGKHKLMPEVSPKKTIEGSLGGLVGSMIVTVIFHIYIFSEQSLMMMILMGLLVGAFAQIGDLFESALKRVANVKDSGRIMPGHGGLLDRLDGVLFGAPLVLVWMTLVEKYL